MSTTTPVIASTRTLPPEIDEVLELPTVHLEELQEESTGAALDDTENGDIVVELPAIDLGASALEHDTAVVAENVVSMRDIDYDVEGGKSTRQMNFGVANNIRAEFVSATFYKSSKELSLGINFLGKGSPGEVRIDSLREGSLAADSPLRPGDKILSVNNKDVKTSKLNNVKVAQILKESVGHVTVVIHNEGGIPDLVESMVMKKEPTQQVGVSLKSITGGQHGGRIAVGSIAKGKPFQNSLLNSDDTVLAVNGTAVAQLDLQETHHLIKDSPQRVTILARTPRDTGVVVAEISDRYLATSTNSVPIIRGNSPGNNNNNNVNMSNINNRQHARQQQQQQHQNNNNQNGHGTTDDAKQLRKCVGLIVFLAIIIAIVAVTVSSQNNDDGDVSYTYNNNDYYPTPNPTPAPAPFELTTEPSSENIYADEYPYLAHTSGFPYGAQVDDTLAPTYSFNLEDCRSYCASDWLGYDAVAFVFYPSGQSNREYNNCQCLTTTECHYCDDLNSFALSAAGISNEDAYLYSKVPLPTTCTTRSYCY